MTALYLSPTAPCLIFTIILRGKEYRCYQSIFVCEEAWVEREFISLPTTFFSPSLFSSSLFPPLYSFFLSVLPAFLPSSLPSSLFPSPLSHLFSLPSPPSQWITESSGLIAIHDSCLPSCSSQKTCCLPLHRKDCFLLSKIVRRGC